MKEKRYLEAELNKIQNEIANGAQITHSKEKNGCLGLEKKIKLTITNDYGIAHFTNVTQTTLINTERYSA